MALGLGHSERPRMRTARSFAGRFHMCSVSMPRRLDLERRPFQSRRDTKGGLCFRDRLFHEAVDIGIGVARIMMKWHQVLDFGERREVQRVLERAVSPTHMSGYSSARY